MFNKLKQFRDLRSQAKTMQNILSRENVMIEKNGVTVVMNGNMEITSVTINKDLSNDKIENAIAESINEAIKKTQKLMAQKMQEMGGLEKFGF